MTKPIKKLSILSLLPFVGAFDSLCFESTVLAPFKDGTIEFEIKQEQKLENLVGTSISLPNFTNKSNPVVESYRITNYKTLYVNLYDALDVYIESNFLASTKEGLCCFLIVLEENMKKFIDENLPVLKVLQMHRNIIDGFGKNADTVKSPKLKEFVSKYHIQYKNITRSFLNTILFESER